VSEDDHFLSRWSRLKQEAARRASDAADQKAPPPSSESAERAGEGAPAGTPQAPVEAFDPASLPPLDSIGVGTDIRGFLARGVPAELTQAALRRAWAADPAIRDFIGLSENSWDFTAPDGVPGFGPLRPTDNIRELLAQASGHRPALDMAEDSHVEPGPPESPSLQAADSQRETAAASDGDEVTQPQAHEPVNIADDAAAPHEMPVGMQSGTIENKNEDVAVQNANNGPELSPMSRPRGHGGALPK
jgi:uncharacterized protein DUF3306